MFFFFFHLYEPSSNIRTSARPHDFFDAQTMDAIRHRAICLNLATHIESMGNGHSVVFHSTVSLASALRLTQTHTHTHSRDATNLFYQTVYFGKTMANNCILASQKTCVGPKVKTSGVGYFFFLL